MYAAKKLPVEILISLDEEPKVNFFPWQIEVCNIAASLCKTISPRGLLSLVLMDTQWNEYPVNTTIDSQGNAVITPRTTPPVFLALNDQISNVAIMVTRTTNEQAFELSTGEEALKAAIEKNLGSVILQIVKDPKVGATLMSCLDIMTNVRARWSRMQKTTKNALKEKMAGDTQPKGKSSAPIDTITNLGSENPLLYLEMLCAELKTVEDVQRHESRIYRERCTPSVIRSKISGFC